MLQSNVDFSWRNKYMVKEDLLIMTFLLAPLNLKTQEDITWLKERFSMYQDMLKGTEIYQEIWQEGYEEGYQKGRAAFHQLILEDVGERFSELMEMATEC